VTCAHRSHGLDGTRYLIVGQVHAFLRRARQNVRIVPIGVYSDVLHPHLCISTVECRLATIAGVPMSTMCVVWLGGCEGAKCEFVSSVRALHTFGIIT